MSITSIKRVERTQIAVLADKVGYVPGIGSVVGVARIIYGIGLAIFSLFKGTETDCDLAGREIVRGFSELALSPFFFTLAWDKLVKGSLEQEGAMESSIYAHGRYAYKTDFGALYYTEHLHTDAQVIKLPNSDRIDNYFLHWNSNP
jgi:hypothetical protein